MAAYRVASFLAGAISFGEPVKVQLTDRATKTLEAPVYFCGFGEIRSNIPPNQCQPARNDELLSQLVYYLGVSVGAQKARRK